MILTFDPIRADPATTLNILSSFGITSFSFPPQPLDQISPRQSYKITTLFRSLHIKLIDLLLFEAVEIHGELRSRRFDSVPSVFTVAKVWILFGELLVGPRK